MLSKVKIKLIQSLKDKKQRNEQDLFLVEGGKAVAELLVSKITVKYLFATEQWLKQHENLIKGSMEVFAVDEKELKQISLLKTPQDVVAVANIPSHNALLPDPSKEFVIALNTIQDPGNMGTIIRIADWYGIQHIVCSPDCADVYNPKVIQATMGSFIRVNVYETELENYLSKENITVYGALMKGTSLYETQLKPHGVLLIGNEGSGTSASLIPLINHPITIPKRGGAESLNAAVATAIICDAWARSL